MRLLSGLAVGLVAAWTVTQVNPAGAQNFDERFSIVPKANASEPDAENQPVPQTEPSGVPQTQPLNEAKSRSGPEDRSTTRSSKRQLHRKGRISFIIGQGKQQLTRGRPQSFVNHGSGLPSPCP